VADRDRSPHAPPADGRLAARPSTVPGGPLSAAACRRFLHTNYNCTDLDDLERWYVAVLELKAVMRSGGEGASGEAFGIYQPTTSYTSFLYDHRGGRRATSLELVHWTDPQTTGNPYPFPWDYGVQSVGFSVPDVAATVERATAEGGRLVRSTGRAALLRDPQGVAVEVVDGGTERPEAHHLRLVCADLDRSVAWYEELGFARRPEAPAVAGGELWDADGEHALAAEVAMIASDDPTYALILTSWSGPEPVGPTYGMPFHRGLYRMAIAVDDVQAAYASLRDAGVARQPPYTFALPGTPIADGLTIMFIRDPDGVLVELVERPRSFFTS
jgi:catechol 2,3-dioxygenase-like lactoylglutathione lyase family enzyme